MPDPKIEAMHNNFFYPLWLASFLTSFGSQFFLLSTAIEYVVEFETALSGALIFAAQSALVFLSPYVVSVISQGATLSRSIAALEVVGMSLSLLILVDSSSYFWLVAIITLRGLFEVTTKALRFVTLKELADGTILKSRTAHLSAAYYLGAFGSVVLLALMPSVTFQTALTLNVSTYCLAAMLSWLVLAVKAAEAPEHRAWGLASRDVLTDRHLLLSFFCIIVVTAAFQGFHTAARTYIPLVHLDRGQTAVASLQLIANIAIVGGALLASRMVVWPLSVGQSTAGTLVIATIAVISSSLSPTLFLSFASYFLFVLCYEVAFTQYQMDILARAPKRSAGKIISTMEAVLWVSLSIGTIVAAWSIDVLGLSATSIMVGAIGLSISLFSLNARR